MTARRAGTTAGMAIRSPATESTPSAVTSARHDARRAANSPWVDRLARIGLAARGLVYLVIAWIAVRIAFGSPHRQADRQGAIHELASNGVGKVLVVAAGVGFVGYAVWRLVEALWGHEDEDGAKKVANRAGSFGRAVLYGWFAVSTFLILAGSSGGNSSDQTSRTWTARLMEQPLGRYLVVAGGVAFVVAGAALAWHGLTTKFDEKLKLGQMSAPMRRAVESVGLVGNVARGVVFGIVGVFLVIAAATYDPQKARGLDGSLRVLAGDDLGKVLLVVVAAGVAAFGLFSVAESRYRRT